MKVLYTCDNEGPALMELDDLIDNFITSEVKDFYPTDIRDELDGRGWYENIHENGHYLILNLEKLHLTLTPEGWDGRVHQDRKVNPECKRNGHRDTGRGICAECGEAI